MNFAVRLWRGDKVSAAEGDSKELFRVASSLLHKMKDTPLPNQTSEKEMANNFGQFLQQRSKKFEKVYH